MAKFKIDGFVKIPFRLVIDADDKEEADRLSKVMDFGGFDYVDMADGEIVDRVITEI